MERSGRRRARDLWAQGALVLFQIIQITLFRLFFEIMHCNYEIRTNMCKKNRLLSLRKEEREEPRVLNGSTRGGGTKTFVFSSDESESLEMVKWR